jgi:uncharacterized protein YbjT (DUF2867 family)
MHNSERIILVTGATGQQGGATARHLLARSDFRVRALTRNPEKPQARTLAELGAEVVKGDFNDQSSMEQALKDVYGVFSVQNFLEAGYEGEIQQGVFLADMAKAAGVEHFIYTSAGSANRNTGVAVLESKVRIEEHIREIGIPYTILRPVFFMNNWEWPSVRPSILEGTLAQPLDPDKPFQQIFSDDIGAFAAIVFSNPKRWLGCELDIAGDERNMLQVAEAFSKRLGRPVNYYQVPWNQWQEIVGDVFYTMYRWFNEEGYQADILTVRSEYPNLMDFEGYLQIHDWS